MQKLRLRQRQVGEKWRIDISSDINRGMSYWRRGVKVDIKGEWEMELSRHLHKYTDGKALSHRLA